MPTDYRPQRPIAEYWDWQVLAACRGMDVEVFYHPFGERRNHRAHRINEAKAICRECPVIDECADHALLTAEPYGIWGGMSEDERARILGRRTLRHPGKRTTKPINSSSQTDRGDPLVAAASTIRVKGVGQTQLSSGSSTP